MVGISPIHHGTTLSGITTIAKALKIFNPAQPVFDFFAPSFFEMGKALSSSFLSLFYLDGFVSLSIMASHTHTLTLALSLILSFLNSR
jgi:hypothetical protein